MRDKMRDRNSLTIEIRYRNRIEDEDNIEYNIKIDLKKENKKKKHEK